MTSNTSCLDLALSAALDADHDDGHQEQGCGHAQTVEEVIVLLSGDNSLSARVSILCLSLDHYFFTAAVVYDDYWHSYVVGGLGPASRIGGAGILSFQNSFSPEFKSEFSGNTLLSWISNNEEALINSSLVNRPNTDLLVSINQALLRIHPRGPLVDKHIHILLARELNLKTLRIVVLQQGLIQRHFIVARIVATRGVLGVGLLVLHRVRVHRLLVGPGLQGHVCAGSGGTCDAAPLVGDGWAESEELVIAALACQDLLKISIDRSFGLG